MPEDLRKKYAGAQRVAAAQEGKGGEETDLRAKYDTASRVPVEPGDDWREPINRMHPDLPGLTGLFSKYGRAGLKTFADAGPKTMMANLEAGGFEVRDRGGMEFSLRKPGERQWYKMDETGWRNLMPTEMLRDLADVIPTYGAVGAGMMKGAALGAAKGGALGTMVAGPAGTAPGAIVGGLGGAGVGAAGMEAAKQGVGAALGYDIDPSEALRKVAEEGVYGMAGEAGGRLLTSGPVRRTFGRAAKNVGDIAAKLRAAKVLRGGRAVRATPYASGAGGGRPVQPRYPSGPPRPPIKGELEEQFDELLRQGKMTIQEHGEEMRRLREGPRTDAADIAEESQRRLDELGTPDAPPALDEALPPPEKPSRVPGMSEEEYQRRLAEYEAQGPSTAGPGELERRGRPRTPDDPELSPQERARLLLKRLEEAGADVDELGEFNLGTKELGEAGSLKPKIGEEPVVRGSAVPDVERLSPAGRKAAIPGPKEPLAPRLPPEDVEKVLPANWDEAKKLVDQFKGPAETGPSNRVLVTIRKKDGSIRTLETPYRPEQMTAKEIAENAKDLSLEDLRDMVRESGLAKLSKKMAKALGGDDPEKLGRSELIEWLEASQPAYVREGKEIPPDIMASIGKLIRAGEIPESELLDIQTRLQASGFNKTAALDVADKLSKGKPIDPVSTKETLWERIGAYSGSEKPHEARRMAIKGSVEQGRYRSPGEVLQVEVIRPGGQKERIRFDAEGKPYVVEGGAKPPEPAPLAPVDLKRSTVAVGEASPGPEPFSGPGTRGPIVLRKPGGTGGAEEKLAAAAELKDQLPAYPVPRGAPAGAGPPTPTGPPSRPTPGGIPRPPQGSPPRPGLTPAEPPGGPRPPRGAPAPSGPLGQAVGLARDVAGYPFKIAGGLLEGPSRGVKRGIEKGYEVATARKPSRAMAEKSRKQTIETLEAISKGILESPNLSARPELKKVAEDTIDALGRVGLRTEEIRTLLEQLDTAFTRSGVDIQDAVKGLGQSIPKRPELSARIAGLPPTAAPELAIAPAALGVGGAPVAALGAVGGVGLVGKGVRNFGLMLMRDPSGETLRGMIQRAPGNVQAVLMPALRKVNNERGYKAAIYVAMHNPEVRKWIRSDLGEEEPDESVRRVPEARTGR